MKVKELKTYLEKLPENATVYITIWKSDGRNNFRINIPLAGNYTRDEKLACIGYADDCKANRIFQDDIKDPISLFD